MGRRKREKKAEESAPTVGASGGATDGKKEKKKKKGLLNILKRNKKDDDDDDDHHQQRSHEDDDDDDKPEDDEVNDDDDDDDVQLEMSEAMEEAGPPIAEIVAEPLEQDVVSAIPEMITEDGQLLRDMGGLSASDLIYDPDEFDVIFDERDHPGTKEYRQIVKDCCTDKFADTDYSPPVYKAIKKKLKGRKFLIRVNASPRKIYREASKPEIIELFGECFNETKRRIQEGISSDDDGSVADSSLQDSARQSEESLSLGDLVGQAGKPSQKQQQQQQKQQDQQQQDQQPPQNQQPKSKQSATQGGAKSPKSGQNRKSVKKGNPKKSPKGAAKPQAAAGANNTRATNNNKTRNSESNNANNKNKSMTNGHKHRPNGHKKSNATSAGGKPAEQILQDAISECHNAQDYARPFDDMTKLQKGIAAEQKLNMLLGLASTPATNELQNELKNLEDLANRMKYASMAPLLDRLENIEVHVTDFFQAISEQVSSTSLHASVSLMQNAAENDHTNRNRLENDDNGENNGFQSPVRSKRDESGAMHNRSIPLGDESLETDEKGSERRNQAQLTSPSANDGSSVESPLSPIDNGDETQEHERRGLQHGEDGHHEEEMEGRSFTGSHSGSEEPENDVYDGMGSASMGGRDNGADDDDEEEEVSAGEGDYEEDLGSYAGSMGDEGSGSFMDGEERSFLPGSALGQTSSARLENAHVLELTQNNDDISSVGQSRRGSIVDDDLDMLDETEAYTEVDVEDDEHSDESSRSSGSGSTSSGSEGMEEKKAGEKNIPEEPPNPKIEQFFDRLQHFFEVRRKVEERAEIMDPSDKIRNLKVKLHSGGIERKNGKFKKEYQQHDLRDKLVRNLDDIYEAAQQARPALKKILDQLVVEVKGLDLGCIVIPPLKPRDRAYEKAKEEYSHRKPGPGESWLYDVVRASVLCRTYKQMSDVNKWLGKKVHIVKSKNRFEDPAFNGYRDLLYHVSIPYKDELAHICEIQVHHRDIKALDDQFGLPKHLEFFRSSFAGPWRTKEDTLQDLRMMNKAGKIDGPLMTRLLRSKDMDQLRLFAGIFREKLDEYDKALELYRRILIMQEKTYGGDHESVASTYLCIGLVLGAKGETDESLLNLQKALAIQESILGTENLEVAESYSAIGQMLSNKGEFNSALAEHRKALKIRESKLGSDHFLVISSLQDIGHALRDKGDFKGAVGEYRKALEKQLAALGNDHCDVAASHSMIGSALCQQGDFVPAMEEQQRALTIREEGMGKNHPTTAESHTQIGIILCQRGDYEGAEWRHRKALRIQEAMLGKDHEDCAVSYSHLATVLSRRGDFEGALKEISRAIKIRENNLGQDHPLTARTYVSRGDILCEQGDYDEGMQEFRRAMVIRQSILGEMHPETAESYNSLGQARYYKEEYDDALDDHRRARAILEAVLGKNHPKTAECYQFIADALLANGDREEALIEHRRALAVRANVLAKDHPDTAASCTRIGTLLLEKGDLVGALVAYRQALGICSGLYGEEHFETAIAHINTGRCLTAQGDLKEALIEFRRAVKIRSSVLGSDHEETAAAKTLVGSVLSMQGEFTKAMEEYKGALDIFKAILGKDSPEVLAIRMKIEMAKNKEQEDEL